MRLLVLLLVLEASACALVPPLTGKRCANDGDCVVDGEPAHYCELALAVPVCLPGARAVAVRNNRPPVGTRTLVVGAAGTTFAGTLGFVDPEGDPIEIQTSAQSFGDGSASLSITDPSTGAFRVVSTGGPLDDHRTFLVTDGQASASMEVFLVLVDAPHLKQWTGAVSDDYNDGGNWAGPGPPTADDSVLVVDGAAGAPTAHVRADGQAKEIFLAASSLDVTATLDARSKALLAGTVTGAGTVHVDASPQIAQIGGSFPALAIDGGATLHGAVTAASIAGIASSIVMEANDALHVAGALTLGSLDVKDGASVDAGAIDVTTLHIFSIGAEQPADRRSITAHGDVSATDVIVDDGARWTLFCDGATEQRVSVPVALDSVVIAPGSAVRIENGGAVADMVLAGSVAVSPGQTLRIQTLHIERKPADLGGSGDVDAAVCDFPVFHPALPSYIHCVDGEGEGAGAAGEGSVGVGQPRHRLPRRSRPSACGHASGAQERPACP